MHIISYFRRPPNARHLFIYFTRQALRETFKGNPISFHYYRRWKTALTPGHNSVSDEQPWITFPVMDLLDKFVGQQTKVFEYGGGGSTLFFVKKAKEVVTVEHDKNWFVKLQSILADKGANNWQGNLIEADPATNTTSLDASNPDHYYTSDKHFREHTFKAYASAIDKYPDGYFDVVLVDGRSRPSCIQHGIAKLRKGGWLVVDNSDRDYYFTHLQRQLDQDFTLLFNKLAPAPYTSFFTKTGVWEKK